MIKRLFVVLIAVGVWLGMMLFGEGTHIDTVVGVRTVAMIQLCIVSWLLVVVLAIIYMRGSDGIGEDRGNNQVESECGDESKGCDCNG